MIECTLPLMNISGAKVVGTRGCLCQTLSVSGARPEMACSIVGTINDYGNSSAETVGLAASTARKEHMKSTLQAMGSPTRTPLFRGPLDVKEMAKFGDEPARTNSGHPKNGIILATKHVTYASSETTHQLPRTRVSHMAKRRLRRAVDSCIS